MARVLVDVKNQAGDNVGIFGEEGFRDWQSSLQRQMGGKIGFAIGEDWLIDCQTLMRHLPPGRHDATLVRRMPVPREVRQKLRGCDVWKAI